MAVSACRCHFSLTSFSVSLLCKCNLVLSALSLPKQICTFYLSQKVSWFSALGRFFFSNHITNFRKGCPMWLVKFLLPSLVFFIWVGILGYCLRQLLWKLALHAKQSKPRILRKSFSPLLFSAVSSTDIQIVQWLQSSKHLSLWSPFAPLYYRGYSEVSESLSQKLWKNAQKF